MISALNSNGWSSVNAVADQWSYPYPSYLHVCASPLWMNDGKWAGKDLRGGNYQNLFPSFVDRSALYPSFMCFNPYTGVRIGEAKNPGPFRISALNIQSLHCAMNENKLDLHSSHVMALSETCATTYVLDKASKVSAAEWGDMLSLRIQSEGEHLNVAQSRKAVGRAQVFGSQVQCTQGLSACRGRTMSLHCVVLAMQYFTHLMVPSMWHVYMGSIKVSLMPLLRQTVSLRPFSSVLRC